MQLPLNDEDWKRPSFSYGLVVQGVFGFRTQYGFFSGEGGRFWPFCAYDTGGFLVI